MNIDNIEIDQNDKKNRRYDFIVHVQSTKKESNSEPMKAEIKGYANFTQERKISRFVISNDNIIRNQ